VKPSKMSSAYLNACDVWQLNVTTASALFDCDFDIVLLMWA